MRPPALSVVIPASDGPPTLSHALASVEAAAGPDDEILVIRDGHGPAAARNAGARLARSPVLVFVDSDVDLHYDALDRIRAAFAADPELTAVFGSYDDEPTARGLVSVFRNLLHHHVHQQSAGDATTFWAGLGAVRRDAFLAAGGFDAESYRAAMMEDIELGMRLSGDGARIVLDPELRASHLKRWTLRSMVHTDLTRRGVPWVRMLISRRELSPALNLSWRHRVTALLYAGATATLVAQLFVIAALLLVAAVTLNAGFYALLARRGGPLLGATGVALHWVHHMTAVLAVPVGVAVHVAHALGSGGGSARLDAPAPVAGEADEAAANPGTGVAVPAAGAVR